MSDAESFDNNPFRALQGRLFPDAVKAQRPSENVVRRKRKAKQASCIGASDTSEQTEGVSAQERDLFLNAVRRVQPVHGHERGTFSLEEMGAVTVPLKKRKKGKKLSPQGEAVPAKKPQENSPHCATNSTSADVHSGHADSVQKEGLLCTEEDADAAAFLRAMNAVQPLAPRGRDVSPLPAQGTPPPQGEASMQDVMEGKLEFALSFTDEYLEGHVVGLDEMTMAKLRSGSLSPEAHLDLHGLNAVQAFEYLRGFLKSSWFKGLRTVLVVPGRGRNSPDGIGVLREKLQNWLTQEPFKRVVLAFCTAQPHDGGPGSVYVLLRKYRKKGRVYWERMPADADLY